MTKLTKKEIEEQLEEAASRRYQDVAYDLPPVGQYHFDAACDHIADHLYDLFNQKYPKANFKRIAKRVVSGYQRSDTAESKRNEAMKQRQWKKVQQKKVQQKPKAWDKKKPTRLGVGSY